jgi:hypothetical protein
LIAREDRDPYSVCYHAEDCDEWIYSEDGEGLIDAEALADKACAACAFEYDTVERVLEETGTLDAYEDALFAISDHEWLERFPFLPPERIPLDAYMNSRMVQGEINKRQKQIELQRTADLNKPTK